MRGIVKEFRPEAGFGKLGLEDGSEMSFDVAASNKRDVRVGEPCEVTVGKGLRGQPKVTLVQFPLRADRTVDVAELVRRAGKYGLLTEWTANDGRAAARELGLDDSALDAGGAAALVEAYYGHGVTERSRRDRVIVLDWRHGQEVDDVVEAMAGVAAISGLRVAQRLEGTVVVRDGDVEESIDLTGTLQALADFLDEALERRGRAERWMAMATWADFEIFALRAGCEKLSLVG